MLFILGAFAILTILVLTGVAGYYLLKLREQEKKRQNALREIDQQAQKKYQKIRKDIIFIAQSYLSDQVELPEASLRISRLVDLVIDHREPRDLYGPFDTIAKAIANIPTHQDWKLLTKQERKKHQKRMQTLTKENEQEAKAAAKKIINQDQALH